jgi:hypothetical protein
VKAVDWVYNTHIVFLSPSATDLVLFVSTKRTKKARLSSPRRVEFNARSASRELTSGSAQCVAT